jgi:DNA-binding response OmpR family regulator
MTSVAPEPVRKRILIVEDDPHARGMLAKLLQDEYTVDVAADGLQCLEAALRTPGPDLIVTDVTMPNLDGITMVQRLRTRSKRRVPVIFLTARDDPRSVIAGIASGARHYIVKPIDLPKLEARIKKALGS